MFLASAQEHNKNSTLCVLFSVATIVYLCASTRIIWIELYFHSSVLQPFLKKKTQVIFITLCMYDELFFTKEITNLEVWAQQLFRKLNRNMRLLSLDRQLLLFLDGETYFRSARKILLLFDWLAELLIGKSFVYNGSIWHCVNLSKLN